MGGGGGGGWGGEGGGGGGATKWENRGSACHMCFILTGQNLLRPPPPSI